MIFKERAEDFDKRLRRTGSKMMIRNYLHIFLMSLMILVMSACVPKATEKAAVCGTNQAFNNISRSCVSVVETRAKPVGTKTSDTLTEETAKTIILSYTDANKNPALSCKVSGISANIEAVSPQILTGSIYTKADLLSTSADNLATNMPAGTDKTNALVYRDNMKLALANARTSFNYSNIITQLGTIKNAVTSILTLAAPYTSIFNVSYHFTNTQTLLADYTILETYVDNHCDCTGGICTTSIAPKIHKNGTAGFSYTITDLDGEGAATAVSLSISALSKTTNYLAPSVQSTYASGVESDNNVPLSYAFNLGSASDFFGTANFTYAHNKTVASAYFPTLLATKTYVASDSGLGKITNCLGLGGSTSTDTSCLYIPNDGDAYSALVPAKASLTLNTDLTITAKAKGLSGNNIVVYFKSLNADLVSFDAQSTAAEKYGLVGTSNDVYVRVVGDAIYVVFNDGISTTRDIANALTSDLVAQNLVDATATGATTPALVSSASTGVGLAGGVDGYDKFSYTVSNGYAVSANTATATILITSTIDNPVWKPYPSTSSPLVAIDDTATIRLEGSTALSMPITVSSTYYDPDNIATTCVVSTDPLDLIIWSSGSNGLSGVTAAEILKSNTDFAQVMPIPTCTITGAAPNKIITFAVDRSTTSKMHAYGNYALLFKVTNGAALTTSLPTFQAYRFFITPINDRPDATAISWTTSSTTPTTSASGATWVMTTRENSTASPSIASADVTVSPDVSNTGFEAAQTVTVTAVSDNQTLLKDANIVVTSVSSTVKRISFTTEKNQSGTANITLTLLDNGGTANGGVNTYSKAIALTVSSVDDPPYFSLPVISTVDTNEGGVVVAGPFTVDEDQGSTDDESIAQGIKIANITSDNTAVLPVSAISVFYDLNDNGVMDTGESRTPIGSSSTVVPGAGVPTLEAALADDSKLHKFYLKLSPVAGVSGNSNITVTVNDGNAASDHFVSTSFSLIVHPIAALHGGWANISAVGIKTDKTGAPVSQGDIQCNYNKSTDKAACNTNQNCLLAGAPNGTVIPDAANVLYKDSSSNRCYRSTSTSKFSWVDVTTSCPITRISVADTALAAVINSASTTALTVASTTGFPYAGVVTIGTEQISYTAKTATTFTGLTRAANSTTAAAHAISDTVSYTANGTNFIKDLTQTPAVSTPVATAINQYYLDTASNTCYNSTESSPGIWAWSASAYVPAKVVLTWKPFTISGSSGDSSVQLYGWNVYRREKGKDFDFISGYLKTNSTDTMTISSASTTTFTDTTAVAGKVYYYLVRPIDSIRHLTISTPEVFSEVRVLAPTENYAFVHRWMVNQEVCNSMHMDTTTTNKVDPTNNYRCPYKGPGESATAGYYDIDSDMLVDISESGCPYTAAPNCTANGCVGIGNPTTIGVTGMSANDIYYDRNSGSCYAYVGGTWTDYNTVALSSTIVAKTNSALNAPLVNIKESTAASICSTRSTTTPFANLGIANGGTANPTATLSLPTKKEFIAYSAFPYNMSDSLVTDLEQGFSLNTQSRCNSNNANGISTAFNDSPIPSTSYIFSLPGTASSSIRSIYTGSVPWGSDYGTESCSSRYGIQDVYGNVAEWVKDTMTCDGTPTAYVCKSNLGTALGNYDFDTVNSTGIHYGFDFVTGPYNNAGSVISASDAFLTNWDFRDESYNAGKFSFPVGMPINVDIATANSSVLASSATLPFFLDIGPTSGITTTQLHEDGIIVNGSVIRAPAAAVDRTGSFAQGGSYLSGNRAGRYSSELILTTTVRPDVGFRCYAPILKTNFPVDTNHTYSY